MTENRIATSTVIVNAPPTEVWKALTDPTVIKQYKFGSDVRSDFTVGSTITYAGEYDGRKYEDHGIILEVVPNRLLRSTHFSPLGGKPDAPENYHTLEYALVEASGGTRLTLTQDNNSSDEEARHSATNWTTMLDALKSVVEGTAP